MMCNPTPAPKFLVIASTVDGVMYYSREFDSMSDDVTEATPMSEIAAQIAVDALNAARDVCLTGDEWNHSYHAPRMIPAPKAAPRVFGDVVLMLLAYKMGESFSKAQNVAGSMFHGSFNVADKMGYSRDSLEWNGAVNGAMSHIGYCEIHCDSGGLISKIQPKT
jgi:hypothetical protein